MPSKEKMERIKQTVADAKKHISEADAYANAEKNLKKLKAGKLGRVARLKRTAKELIGGKKTYLKKKKKKSSRTKDTEHGLGVGNALTQKEIDKFGGK